MQIWAESGKSALPICNYSQILYQFLTFTQNLKRSLQIPEDILEIEDSNCTGTEFAYQMRWIRTNLKNKELISSPKRGFWVFQNNSSK